MTALEAAKAAVKALDSKKGVDIALMDISGVTTLGDYFVVASAPAPPDESLADEVDEQLSKLGLEPRRVEGYQSANWILLDYYEVIVHIFLEETREFYSLERLWSDAPRVDLTGLVTQN